MNCKTIVLIGGPETGKTNYLARLWKSLKSPGGALSASELPENIGYVEEALGHLLQGVFVPRTQQKGISGSIDILVQQNGPESSASSKLVVPDMMGEIWKRVVVDRTVPIEIEKAIEQASGAMIFVRVLSELNYEPLDWVTAKRLLNQPLVHTSNERELPTQVQLCELLKILEHKWLESGELKRVAVMVAGWDRLDEERANLGPFAFLQTEFPLFAGKLLNKTSIEIRTFGLSVVGGDFACDSKFKDQFLDLPIDQMGYTVEETEGSVRKEADLTLALSWLLQG